MKRLSFCLIVSLSAVSGSTSATSSSCEGQSAMASSSLAEQKCGLRNLHQYPKARHKSLVKDTRRFSRNWWLTAGNNYELVDEKGHELEATENFGLYRDDAENDEYVLFTEKLSDLPPDQRLQALVKLMERRWKVKDSNRGFDKAKMLLQALECFSEMRLAGQVGVFAELPESDQDTFLQYVEACAQFAHATAHSHPESVAILIRATQICDEMRCVAKRDELLHMTEMTAHRMDRTYAFARSPSEQVYLSEPLLEQNCKRVVDKQNRALRRHFRDRPDVLEPLPSSRLGRFRGMKNRRYYHVAMKDDDYHRKLLREPYRPEESSWKE